MDELNQILSKSERQKFYDNWNDRSVREEFFKHNIRLAHYIARRFHSTDIEYEDLFQHASIGLWKAVESFKPSKGCQFSTYAARVMNNEILMAIRRTKRCPPTDGIKITSIDAPTAIDGDGNVQTIGDTLVSSVLEIDDDLLGEGLSDLIARYMSKYDKRDIKIVKMYIDGKTQKVIAQQMQLSQSYISRIISRFKRGMKSYIRTHWSDEIP